MSGDLDFPHSIFHDLLQPLYNMRPFEYPFQSRMWYNKICSSYVQMFPYIYGFNITDQMYRILYRIKKLNFTCKSLLVLQKSKIDRNFCILFKFYLYVKTTHNVILSLINILITDFHYTKILRTKCVFPKHVI